MPLTDLESLQAAMLQTDFNNYADFLTYYIAKETNSGESFADFEDEMRSNPIFKSYADFFLFKIAQVDFSAGGGGGGGSSFLQGGTGAVSRTLQNKAREWVTPEDFGALGYELADDTAAILAAVAYCNSNGYDLRFKKGCSYIVKSPIVFNGSYNVWGFPQLYYTDAIFVGAFITIGVEPTVATTAYTNSSPTIQLGTIVSSQSGHSYANTFVGVECINMAYANISIQKIDAFGTGLKISGVANSTWSADGCLYSTFNLPDVQYCNQPILVNSRQVGGGAALGFVNQNIFNGGAIKNPTVTNAKCLQLTGNCNANWFNGLGIETGGTGFNVYPIYLDGASITLNRFVNFRNENNLGTYYLNCYNGAYNNFCDVIYNETGTGLCKGAYNDAATSSQLNVFRSINEDLISNLTPIASLNNLVPDYINQSGVSKVGFYPYSFLDISATTPRQTQKAFNVTEADLDGNNLEVIGGKLGTRGLGFFLKVNGLKHIVIKTTVTNPALLPTPFLVPYKNGLPVTDADISFAVRQYDTNGVFVSMTKNTVGTTSAFGILTTAGTYTAFILVDDTQVDEIFIGATSGASDLIYSNFEVFAGDINNKKTFAITEKKTITQTLSTGGTIVATNNTAIKGVIITGTAADTISIGTTAAGTDIVDTAVLDSNGKFISNDLLYFTTDQTLHASGNTNPVTVILPI